MVKCFLVDFSDSLSNSRYFSDLHPDIRQEINEILFDDQKVCGKWMKGELSYNEILTYLAKTIHVELQKLERSLIQTAGLFTLNQALWDSLLFLKQNGYSLACVTINTDIFNVITAPQLKLSSRFDLIINSFDFGTNNKQELCNIAMEKLDSNLIISECLLIDDQLKNIQKFKKEGGQVYYYINDVLFSKWFNGFCKKE